MLARTIAAAFLMVALNGVMHAQQPDKPSVVPTVAEMPAAVRDQLNNLRKALQAAQTAGDARAAAEALNRIGTLYLGVSDWQNALDAYNQALPLARKAGDRGGEAATLSNVGDVYYDLGRPEKALDFYNQALRVEREVGNRKAEAETLNAIGRVEADLEQPGKALDFYNQALPIQREVSDREGEATTLNNIGRTYSALSQQQKALNYFEGALSIRRQMGDRYGEAAMLNNIGYVYSALSQQRKALDFYNQALPIERGLSDRRGEATTLNNIGLCHADLGEPQTALDFYTQALRIRQAVEDRGGEAATLNNIASVYFGLGQPQKALDFYTQALSIVRQVGERYGEAVTLNNIGSLNSALGQPQRALDSYRQALIIEREVGDRYGEESALNNIGRVYSGLGQAQKALDSYTQALTIEREVADRGGEGTTLSNLGYVYSDLKQPQKALDYYNQALSIRREVGDRAGEAATLDNVAYVYVDLGQPQKALDSFNQALSIAAALKNPLAEADVFRGLMKYFQPTQPALAIFFGKQAINMLQQVRGNMQGLEKDLQKSFLASKESAYRDLANLLIDKGRLPEAQQVLDLLKDQEYRDFVRGETAGKGGKPLSLTPAEQKAQAEYEASTAKTVAQGEEWATLSGKAQRTPEEEARLKQLSDLIAAANKELDAYYKRLYTVFGRSEEANQKIADIKDKTSDLQSVIGDLPGTVALYTLVSKDRYRVIFIGPAMVAREYAIPETELNHKVAELQKALRDPRLDALPAAQALYKVVVGPVADLLVQANAKTIVWELDEALRYVPVSALYDGKQFMVEKYANVTVTTANSSSWNHVPDPGHLRALGLGVSRQYETGLEPLPAVSGELNAIVRDPEVKDSHGVVPGTIALNDQFTEKALEEFLRGRYSVVHIASHFVFNPAGDDQSYLLLAGMDNGGAGYELSLADLRHNQNLRFQGTELLTLSACETGMGGNTEDGREVDGLGTMAERKGANAVMASLWEVADESTGELMADFYQHWVSGAGAVSKVEALRQAQMDLLQGRIAPRPNLADPSAPTSFAHPYYWAPFILMGNWR